MTTRLTMICHAATFATRRESFPADEGLDAKAAAGAAALAGRLPRADRAFAGRSRRTRQTAAALDLTAKAIAAMDDCDFGRWRGRTLADVAAEEPDAVAVWLSDPESAPHGGESIASLVRRVGNWLDTVRRESSIVAVTHPAVVRATVVHVLGVSASCFWRIDAGPLSVTDLRHDARRWSLRSVALDMLR